MSDRAKKIMRLALQGLTEDNKGTREVNCSFISESQALVSNIEQQPSSPHCEITEKQVINVEPQASSSKHKFNVTQMAEASNVYMVEGTSATKSIFKRVPATYPLPSSSSEIGSDLSSGSSDNYNPSSSDESSDSCERLLTHKEKSPIKKPKKRVRNVSNWGRVRAKTLRNSGKSYISRTGKVVKARKMGAPCTDKCILSCTKKLTEDYRCQLFNNYWAVGSLQRQRDFLNTCIETLVLKYRRITAQEPRRPNCAFYLVKDEQKIRVCKTFLINTLGITERQIRTVIEAKMIGTGMAPVDKRGQHGKHRKTDPEILESVRNHIKSIPRIESHYLRSDTTREFIDGGLSIAEMHRNYSSERSAANLPAANYDAYAHIFNTEFNIGFFVPKKDQCDQCEAYKNATGEEKAKLQNAFLEHQEEKELSRIEKNLDKELAQNKKIQLAVYDLQAVLPVPTGQTSAFFYKSRLNCYNFTVTEIGNDKTACFFWHEGIGNRGVVEIATCVLQYLEELSKNLPGTDVVFYSDNCGGQQKNKYMIAAYLYAVQRMDIRSITHKYLIRGHTQNEGDAIHSIIERALKSAKKSGPIYVPDQYISIIRSAKKKGNQLHLREMGFSDFQDIKALHDEMAPYMAKDIDGNVFKVSEIKLFRCEKGSDIFQYKNSYKQPEWGQVQFRGRKRRSTDDTNLDLKPAYTKKMTLSGNKIRDLNSLVNSNIIPKYYKGFYDSLST